MARAGSVPGAREVGREWRFPPGSAGWLPLVAPLTPDASRGIAWRDMRCALAPRF
jgi:hypothetical protein